MDLSGRPLFSYADHVGIVRTPSGAWRGADLEGEEVAFDDEQIERALPIATDEDGNGLYAMPDPLRARGYRFAFENDGAHVVVETDEGQTRRITAEDFLKSAVRVDGQGRPICSFLEPLHEQYTKCMERGRCEMHILDIGDMAERKRREGRKAAEAIDAWLYDAVSSGISDGADFMTLMARVTARTGRPVHERTGLSEAIPGHWAEIRDFPQYMMDSIRTIFEGYMQEIGVEFPLERISRLHLVPGAPAADMLSTVAELEGEDRPFEGGNLMRDYRTSPVARFRGDGFTAITFSDIAGTYIYAWTDDPQPEPGNDPGSRM